MKWLGAAGQGICLVNYLLNGTKMFPVIKNEWVCKLKKDFVYLTGKQFCLSGLGGLTCTGPKAAMFRNSVGQGSKRDE